MAKPEHSALRVEPLASSHRREGFSCGVAELDSYLKLQSGQDAKRHSTAVYILVQSESPKALGFYTLSATSVSLPDIPREMAKKLPRYPSVPAILLGRLAVDLSLRGQGCGEWLLMDALNRCLKVKDVGWNAVIVDAKDEAAADFYRHHHFVPFSSEPRRLLLSRNKMESLFPADL